MYIVYSGVFVGWCETATCYSECEGGLWRWWHGVLCCISGYKTICEYGFYFYTLFFFFLVGRSVVWFWSVGRYYLYNHPTCWLTHYDDILCECLYVEKKTLCHQTVITWILIKLYFYRTWWEYFVWLVWWYIVETLSKIVFYSYKLL